MNFGSFLYIVNGVIVFLLVLSGKHLLPTLWLTSLIEPFVLTVIHSFGFLHRPPSALGDALVYSLDHSNLYFFYYNIYKAVIMGILDVFGSLEKSVLMLLPKLVYMDHLIYNKYLLHIDAYNLKSFTNLI